jgi:hypothetical protein
LQWVSLRAKEKLVLGVLLAAFAALVVRNAWLSDDAYITFRTVDNFIHGYGLTWNVAERVQSVHASAVDVFGGGGGVLHA